MKKSIVIVGSSNTDLVIETTQFPKPGETVMGGAFHTFAGGKGANQAVACARLGGNAYFIAKVGNDDFGKTAIEGFKKDGIHTDYIFKTSEYPSGVAVILINSQGENEIVVSPGANSQLNSSDLDSAKHIIAESDLILAQLEVPLQTVEHLLKISTKLNKKVILNPAPATPLSDEILSSLYVITPNETEAEILTGIKVTNESSASQAASVLIDKGVKNVIITLGEKGAYFKSASEAFLVPTNKVDVIDTTAAGDTFNGALTVALAEEKSFKEAIKIANLAAGLSVSKLGAQASVPFRSELKL